MSIIHLKRIYAPPAKSDGTRILVERLWPRGVSKEKARIDLWAKDAAPSPELRVWFGHDPKKWPAFQRKYHQELRANPTGWAPIQEPLAAGPVTFVFASKEERYNNAVALKEFLDSVG